MQEDKVQLSPQAAKQQTLGTALCEFSCAVSELSWDAHHAVVLDLLARIPRSCEPRALPQVGHVLWLGCATGMPQTEACC